MLGISPVLGTVYFQLNRNCILARCLFNLKFKYQCDLKLTADRIFCPFSQPFQLNGANSSLRKKNSFSFPTQLLTIGKQQIHFNMNECLSI